MTLQESVPESTYQASGSVKSWKTEDIGFEVSGRVEWVREPGQDVDGRIVDPDGVLVQEGTPLAQIEPDRYDIAVEAAEANLEVARLRKENIQIRIDDALPAELRSAEANLELAKIEFGRMERLKDQNAASKSEYDQAENAVRTRDASIKSIEASMKQAEAELQSAIAEIKRADQSLRDARRDLANTTLYGSYQGQISEVMVVPGSVVSAGTPVLTLQMTNPITVEVELSAEQSRSIRSRRSLTTTFLLPDGTERTVMALVYSIDPSADPTTRTFTMTLLLLNEKFRDDLPPSISSDTVARSENVWPLQLNRMMGTSDDVILVEDAAIVHDDRGAFIYVITNAQLQEPIPPVLKVRPQRLIEKDLRIPFLGNWVFRSVEFVDDERRPAEVPLTTLYVGEIETGENDAPNWDGESVALDAGSVWMLRPGDLVTVDLASNDVAPGFYVPIEAIYRELDESFVFTVEEGKAKRIAVTMHTNDSQEKNSLVEIEIPQLTSGMTIIVGGVHYLRDGEVVQIVRQHHVEKLASGAESL
ncbi:HlyD family efflux transporter periplasmic adaptor subunit [Rhodopirellula sp. ICT_H3.1]|uniref:HlyD family efflux transporter periplasmic adaptor subunit n=2 Tax=Aporhodopirellula aestuarii TaxID=2950107 RepID=A0ABT0U9X7_9BACT|nr:HlyD family efflux transporter periplasmic adaptor subunit [Aporhodopirellula aestuarii]MCM2373747.1 HlyD family efflux transporter periplasmic adaptor subunit [Aporhodopirellula aestuarii]